MLLLLVTGAQAADVPQLVHLMDSITDPVVGTTSHTTKARDWVFDLQQQDFVVDCSGFISYMVWEAWLKDLGATTIDVGGKPIISPTYTMNGLNGHDNNAHGPFSASWTAAVQRGYLTIDGTRHPLALRTDVTDIQRGDLFTRNGHAGFIDGLRRITDDFWLMDVLHAISPDGVKRSTYYLGVEHEPDGTSRFKYYSTASRLRADQAHEVWIAGFE